MEKLIEGIRRFRSELVPSRRQLFDHLKTGQAPKVLFITCSDSRIVPHLLTGSEPGDLFVIRNAGNLIPPPGPMPGGEAATLEYAVSVLGVEHIVVCGHSDCGAMKGLLDPDSLKTLPAVARWLEFARPARQVVDALCTEDTTPTERLDRVIEVNTLRQLDSLRGHPCVAAALARDKVTLHAWVYHIGSGIVTSYDDSQQAFVELNDVLHPVGRYLALAATDTETKPS